MSLPNLALAEPLVTAMVTLLDANLNSEIDALNNTITDSYTVPHVAQVVPYVPVPSTLESGTPVVGVQEIGADFEDDLQFSLRALHTYAVIGVVTNPDHVTLAWQLRRLQQAIANTVQADRLLGRAESIMIQQGGAYSVQFVRTEPGQLLGDVDPVSPEAPPRSYLSWVGLIFTSNRDEV